MTPPLTRRQVIRSLAAGSILFPGIVARLLADEANPLAPKAPHFPPRAKRVVHLEEHVRPFRVSSISLKAHSVLELPPHTIFRTGTRVGDQLEIGRPGGCSASFDRVEAAPAAP